MGSTGGTFYAEPEAIAGLSGQVSRQGEYAQHYRGLLAEPGLTTSESEEGLLGLIFPAVDRFQDGARTNTGLAGELGLAAGQELRKAALFYRQTDVVEAATLDAQYRPERSQPVDQGDVTDPRAAGTFRDTADPREDRSGGAFNPGRLANTGDKQLARDLTKDEGWPTGLEQKVDEIVGLGGTLASVVALIEDITGVDILEEVVEVINGDWQKLHRQSVLFDQVGFAFTAIKENIDQGRAGIQPRWEGNAASNAENWLAQYSRSCAAHTEYMTQAADRIKDFAQSSYHYIEYVRKAIGVLIDIALEILSFFTGGTLSAVIDGIALAGGIASDIGTLVDLAKGLGDGVDPDDLLKVAALIAQMNKNVQLLLQVVGLLVGLAHGAAGYIEALAALEPVKSQPWPPEPYDHQGV